jgi:hypothetical protein
MSKLSGIILMDKKDVHDRLRRCEGVWD